MNVLGRLELRSIGLLCVAACWLLGCAEGYEGVGAIRQSAASGLPSGGGGMITPRAGNGGAGGASGASGTTGTSGSAGAGTAPGATGAGMPCLRGETSVCTCVDKGTMGQATCVFDAASPLDGFFSDCGRCPEPMTMDPGDVTAAGSGGMGGGSGSGGRSGSGGSSGGGSAGSGSGGSTSPPPTTGGGRTCASPCNQPCFPIGILACCNPLGVCGCTWAPGGYCL